MLPWVQARLCLDDKVTRFRARKVDRLGTRRKVTEGPAARIVIRLSRMMASSTDWRAELIEAHPDLFHPPVDDPRVAQGSPECGEGWRDLLERAFARIRAAVQVDGGSFKITQIKEKYATLRLYWKGALSPEADAQVEDAVDLAEARSACTCELCGEEGRLYRAGGVLMTRCADHAQGSAVEIRPGFENIHIEERFVGDRRVVRCRRYDRETDSFIDVDPSSLKIEGE
jgi:hypothetical protein